MGPTKKSSLHMADVVADNIETPPTLPSYPTVNGWTADPDKFCAGLPGAIAPLGDFDPLGFTMDLPTLTLPRFTTLLLSSSPGLVEALPLPRSSVPRWDGNFQLMPWPKILFSRRKRI